MVKLINGAVYRNSDMKAPFILIFAGLSNDKDRLVLWSMLYICRSELKDLSAPIFRSDEDGKRCFTEKELEEKFNLKEWIILDGRLRIEKIDYDMSLVDSIIGGELVESHLLRKE